MSYDKGTADAYDSQKTLRYDYAINPYEYTRSWKDRAISLLFSKLRNKTASEALRNRTYNETLLDIIQELEKLE